MKRMREWGPVTELALNAAGMASIGILLGAVVEYALGAMGDTAGRVVSLSIMASSIVAFVILLRDVVRQIRRMMGEMGL